MEIIEQIIPSVTEKVNENSISMETTEQQQINSMETKLVKPKNDLGSFWYRAKGTTDDYVEMDYYFE